MNHKGLHGIREVQKFRYLRHEEVDMSLNLYEDESQVLEEDEDTYNVKSVSNINNMKPNTRSNSGLNQYWLN